MQTNMHDAKTQLSKLVDAALNGEEVIIAKRGKPAVRLVPYKKTKRRQFGLLKDKINVGDDFDSQETSDEILSMFESE